MISKEYIDHLNIPESLREQYKEEVEKELIDFYGSNHLKNLISEKDFYKMSTEDQVIFYIDNGIFEPRFKPTGDHYIPKVSYQDGRFCELLVISEEVCHAIFGDYMSQSNIHWNIRYELKEFNVEYRSALDDKSKIKILKKAYKKTVKKLKKNPLSRLLKVSPGKLKGTELSTFIDIFLDKIDNELVFNHVFSNRFNRFYDSAFQEWTLFERYHKVLSFLKKELEKIQNTTTPEKVNKIGANFNFKIFKTKEAESHFLSILIEMQAIDENYLTIDNVFKPVCNSIFTSEYSNSIFKKGLAKVDYLRYLSEKYSSNININKGRLSTSTKYNDDVDRLLNQLIIT